MVTRRLATLANRVMAVLRNYLHLHVCRIMVRPFTSAVFEVRHPELSSKVMSEAELIAACEERAMDLRQAQVRAALARGDKCVGAFESDSFIGYVWFAFQAAPDTGNVWVDFSHRYRYAYKSYLRPDWRGRGLSHEIYNRANELCPSGDRSMTIGYAHLDNLPSIRAARRMGGRTVGFAGHISLLGITLAFRTPGASRHGFRFFHPRAMPRALTAARAT
jgi:GNAT superfamily N-acetyltransferase